MSGETAYSYQNCGRRIGGREKVDKAEAVRLAKMAKERMR